VAECHSFCILFFFIQLIHSLINICWGPSPYLHSCRLSEGGTSMGCRAEIRTRACLTASQRAPTEPHCTPSKIKQPFFTYSSYLKGHDNKVFCLWFSATQEVHCNGNSVYIFLFWELRGLSPNFHIHVSVSDLYIPRIGPHIFSSRKGRPIVGIYNSLTDTWMWKLGLKPRFSISGYICFKFSAFCLCSVLWIQGNNLGWSQS
jgi:hypothetical protein